MKNVNEYVATYPSPLQPCIQPVFLHRPTHGDLSSQAMARRTTSSGSTPRSLHRLRVPSTVISSSLRSNDGCVRKRWTGAASTNCTPLYLLKIFSRSGEEGVCVFSRLFMYDCKATSRRRCLSRYRLASRELEALEHLDTSTKKETEQRCKRSSGDPDELSEVAILSGDPRLPEDGGDEWE